MPWWHRVSVLVQGVMPGGLASPVGACRSTGDDRIPMLMALPVDALVEGRFVLLQKGQAKPPPPRLSSSNLRCGASGFTQRDSAGKAPERRVGAGSWREV